MLVNASVGDLTRIDATIADSLFTPVAIQIGPLHIDLPFEQALKLRDELTRVITTYSAVEPKPAHGPVRKQLDEFNARALRELFGDGAL